MGNTITSTCAQTRGMALWEARDKFTAVVGHDKLLRSGQFVWAHYYWAEVKKETDRILALDDTLRRELLEPEKTSLVEQMWDAALKRVPGRYRDLHERAKAIVAQRIQSVPSSESGPARAMQSLLLRGQESKESSPTYVSANGKLAGGSPMHDQTPEYHQVFVPIRLGYHGLYGICDYAAGGCYSIVDALSRYLRRVGGIRQCRFGDSPANLGDIYLNSGYELPVIKGPAPRYDLIKYSSRLSGLYKATQMALDNNLVLRASVISGIRIGQGDPPFPQTSVDPPDHYIMVIGQSAQGKPWPHVEYLFWDGDPGANHRPGPNFGSLFQVSQRHMGAELQPIYPHGRLSTAFRDDDLAVDEHGKHVSGPNIHNKRYQVTSVVSL